MQYAIVDGDDQVVNVIELEPGADFEPPEGCTLVEGRGWPQEPYVPPPVDLVAYATNKRWEREVGGTTFAGISVPTDDRAKLLILGAAQTLSDEAEAPFVVGGVNHGMLTGAQFRAVSAAIVAHVQATFATLAAVLAGIGAETITTTAEIDAAFAE